MNFLILEGTDDPWVASVPTSWFDGEVCWWPMVAGGKFIELGYEPDRDKWDTHPARVRKAFGGFCFIVPFIPYFKITNYCFIIILRPDTYEEAKRNEKKQLKWNNL